MQLRTCFAHTQKEFGWQWTIDDFKKSQMLSLFIEKLYKECLKQYGHAGYGKPNRMRCLSEAHIDKISLAIFNKDDPCQHIMKILFGSGAKLGFRGQAYVKLLLAHLRLGVFEEGHLWAGYQWIGFAGFTGKTKKPTLSNPHVREDEEFMRVPVIPGDPTNLGACIQCFC